MDGSGKIKVKSRGTKKRVEDDDAEEEEEEDDGDGGWEEDEIEEHEDVLSINDLTQAIS